MGVTGLWKILDGLCLGERKDLSSLSGKRVAVDLSGWVVQALTCPGLNKSKNPYLKNLFFRASRLLNHGVFPVIILEGKVPQLKEEVFKSRNHQATSQKGNLSRPRFDRILNECKTFLQSLGVPCIKSSGEAEALCAFLYTNKIVDAIITEDGDTFLYGADTVLRDFSAERLDPHVVEYSLQSPKNALKLDQTKLIALALLLGCDYYKSGVHGIGQETAVKLLTELDGCDVLQRFFDWKEKSESELFPGYEPDIKKQGIHCKQCAHSGSMNDHTVNGCVMCNSNNSCFSSNEKNPCSCAWHKSQDISTKHKTELKVYHAAKEIENFPNLQIIEEFKNYTDNIPDEGQLEWNCPNLEEFQNKALEHFNWSSTDSHKKCFPLVTLWHQIMRDKLMSKNGTFLYKPIKILKKRKKEGKGCFEVQWSTLDESLSDLELENLCTIEDEERFKIAYPELCEAFSNFKSDSKIKTISSKLPNKHKKVILENVIGVLHTSIPENEIDALTPIQATVPNLVHESSQNKSMDSFSLLPLSERIKIISDNLPKKSASLEHTATVINNPFIPVKPLLQSNYDIPSLGMLSSKGIKKPSQTFTPFDSSDESLSKKMNPNEMHQTIQIEEKVAFPCIEFSDSDESYINNSINDMYDISSHSPRRVSVLVQNSPEFNCDGFLKTKSCYTNNQLDFLSPFIDKDRKTPKLVYSVKDISPKSIMSKSSANKTIFSVCNSTPKLNFRKSLLQKVMLSATKESPVYYNKSINLYSPVIFNSSNDESI